MRWLRIFALLALLIQPVALAEAGQGDTPAVQHVVLMWLNNPDDKAALHAIEQVSHSFTTIPGVVSLHIGRPVASERAIVDDSFDLGLIIGFDSAASMQRYLNHPSHKDAVKRFIKPHVKRIQVYDIER